jgi:hypothetical protein
MNPHLNYIVAQQRIADLHRAAERARLARNAGIGRRTSRVSTVITRLSAQLARLTGRLTPTGLRDANDPVQTPLAHDPAVDLSTPTETSCADVC